MSTQAIVSGSLGVIAQRDGLSLAESFLSADVLILIDISSSMNTANSRGDQTRFAVACEELTRLQNDLPGKVAVISFANEPAFCPAGVLSHASGGTDLLRALQFVQVADGTVSFVVVSDGEPNAPRACIALARRFSSKISTVYVGAEDDMSGGRKFLAELAAVSGGKSMTADRAQELAEKTKTLMLGTRR